MRLFNKFKLLLKYLHFRLRYPSVLFVRPDKTIGTYYSQGGQDLFMSAILFGHQQNEPSGRLVVDIGANHPEKFSNSLFFEKYFGCKTLAIDALAEFSELWRSSRPNAEFLPVALGRNNGVIKINIPVSGDNMFSTVDEKLSKGHCEARQVPLTTLSQVFEERRITDVFLMSLDVEGFELEVLQGMDFDKVSVKAILVENNNKKAFGSDELRDFLINKGYIFYARIGWLDDVFLLPEILEN